MTATKYTAEDNALVAELVVRAQAGDGSAFDALIERFQEMVFAIVIRRVRNYAEAEEVSQDVFLKVFTHIGQLREAAAFPGWLKQVAVRTAINCAVRKRHGTPVEPDILACTLTDEVGEPLDNVLDSEQAEQVQAGIERLGELDQATLKSFYFEGHSVLEMADEFDAPVGTIKRRLHVARKRLAEEMAEILAV